MNKPLSLIMTKNVVTVSPNDNLSLVKELLFQKKFQHIPVVEDEKLVGIITSYDLMKLDMKFEEYPNIKVESVMTKKVVTLEPNEKIGTVTQIFLRHLFHGVPIVDEHKILKGIVTTHDIMKYEYDKAYPNDELEKAYRKDS